MPVTTKKMPDSDTARLMKMQLPNSYLRSELNSPCSINGELNEFLTLPRWRSTRL